MLVSPLDESLDAVPFSLFTQVIAVDWVHFDSSLLELLLIGIIFFLGNTGSLNVAKPVVRDGTVRVNSHVIYFVNLRQNLTNKLRAFLENLIEVVILVLLIL